MVLKGYFQVTMRDGLKKTIEIIKNSSEEFSDANTPRIIEHALFLMKEDVLNDYVRVPRHMLNDFQKSILDKKSK